MTPEEHLEILREAAQLERRRVEISLYAIEHHIANLLPATWASMIEYESQGMVEVTINLDIEPKDSEVWTERECRNFIRFLGEVVQEIRVRNQAYLEDEEDDEDDE